MGELQPDCGVERYGEGAEGPREAEYGLFRGQSAAVEGSCSVQEQGAADAAAG